MYLIKKCLIEFNNQRTNKITEKEVDDDELLRFTLLDMQNFAKKYVEAIIVKHCCEELPTSTQLLSDCKKRFKELEGKGKLDYRSYMNGYLDSFSKNVVSKIK